MLHRVLALVWIAGCTSGKDGSTETDEPTESDTDTDTDADSDTDADTDSDTDADTDSDTDADTDSDTDSDSDTDADSDTDTDTDSDTDADTDSDTDADTDSDTDADTDADADADTDADADADTDADTDLVETGDTGLAETGDTGVVETGDTGDTDVPPPVCDPAEVRTRGLFAVFDDGLFRVDPTTAAVTRLVDLPTNGVRGWHTALDGTWYAVQGVAGAVELVRADPCTGEVTLVAALSRPSGGLFAVEGFAILDDGSAWVAFSQDAGFTSESLGALDLTTGVITRIGAVTGTGENDVDDLWADGDVLYGRDTTQGGCQFTGGTQCTRVLTIDTATAAGTQRAQLPGHITQFARNPAGGWWGYNFEGDVVHDEWLYSFAETTWVPTPIGDLDPTSTLGAAADLFSAELVCDRPLQAVIAQQRYWIDPATGLATDLGVTLDAVVGGLHALPDGTWVGVRDPGTAPTLVEVDLCSGTTTTIGALQTGGSAVALAEGFVVVDSGAAWAGFSSNGGDASSESIGAVDLATGEITAVVAVSGLPGNDVDDLFTDGTTVYARDAVPAWATQAGPMNPGTGAVTSLYSVPRHVTQFTFGDGSVWAYNAEVGAQNGWLFQIDPTVTPWTEVAVGPFDPTGALGAPSDLFWIR